MEISADKLLQILKKHILAITLCAILGLLGAFTFSKFLIEPSYESYVRMNVTTGADSLPTTQSDLTYLKNIVSTYIELLNVRSFYGDVADKSGLGYSSNQLAGMIDFSILNDTTVFQIAVTSHNPGDSKAIADAIADITPTKVKNVTLVEEAIMGKQTSPNVNVNSALGFILGGALAALVFVLREVFDVRIKSEEDLNERFNIPVLGSIPDFSTRNV